MTPWFLTDKSKPVPLVRVTVSEVSRTKTQRQTFREIPPDPTKITLTFSQLYPRNAAPLAARQAALGSEQKTRSVRRERHRVCNCPVH
jgi:hypothetical protein